MVKSIANSQAPKSVSSTTSFMQYCLDIRMDEVWKEFMELLLLDSDHLPPNPFLHLVTAMRKGNMRWGDFQKNSNKKFILWRCCSVQSLFETDAATIDRVLQRKRIPVQGLSEIINIAGTTAYGYRKFRNTFILKFCCFFIKSPLHQFPLNKIFCFRFIVDPLQYPWFSPILRPLYFDLYYLPGGNNIWLSAAIRSFQGQFLCIILLDWFLTNLWH